MAKMFTKDTQYTRANIEAYEKTMGRGFMSAGGLQTTKETAKLLEDVLTSRPGGAKILDVGCGIGGAAFYFAETYGAHVHGVDINQIGIEMAIEESKKANGKGSTKFEVMDVVETEMKEGSYDIIYSRDALLHIPNDVKKILFEKFFKWLTPGGKVCVTDYCIGPASAEVMSPSFEQYLKARDYHLFTPENYKKCFVDAGFDDDLVVSEDKAFWYCNMCQREVDNVALPGLGRDRFLSEEGKTEDDLEKLISTYQDKIEMTLRGDRSYVFLHGTKSESHAALRTEVANAYKKLFDEKLIMSCDGNVSARATPDTFLVTPSGVMVSDLTPDKVVLCTNDGKGCPGERYKPSSEANLHDAIYRTRPDVGGIVHSHSIYVCALAACHLPLPPAHYAVCELLQEFDFDFSSASGGSTAKPAITVEDATVKCAPYFTYGTRALSKASLEALGKNNAVLLANHGSVVVGESLEMAMYNTERLERECEIYWKSLQLSSLRPPQPLSLQEINDLQKADTGYGQGKETVEDEDLPGSMAGVTMEDSAPSSTPETSPITMDSTTTNASLDLTGRCALVTGASSGIGKAIATALASAGVNVCLAARRLDRISELAKSLCSAHPSSKCIAVATDVTSFTNLQNTVATAETEFGKPLDILVNNAGVMHYTFMKNLNLDQWTETIDVNCKGVTNTLAAALPSLLSNRNGHVINISSDAGRVVFPGLSVYSGTKFFVEALTKGLRLECAESHGLKVTAIQPGDCKTEISTRDTDMEAREACAQSNMDREYWLDADDVAKAVLWAVSQPDHVAIQELMIEPKHAPA